MILCARQYFHVLPSMYCQEVMRCRYHYPLFTEAGTEVLLEWLL